MPLLGYPSRWSVRAGERLEFMVSAGVASYEAEIIRVTGRGPRPDDSPAAQLRARAQRGRRDVPGRGAPDGLRVVRDRQRSRPRCGRGLAGGVGVPDAAAAGPVAEHPDVAGPRTASARSASGSTVTGTWRCATGTRTAVPVSCAGRVRSRPAAGTTPPPAPVRPAASWPCCAGSAPALTWGPRSSAVPRTCAAAALGTAATSPRSARARSSPALDLG